MNRSDLKLYTPDKWYFVQRENGRELSQLGFHTKQLAESFASGVEKSVAQSVASGAKRRTEVTDHVEEAKGWEVNGRVFSDFHEALWYKWNNEPATINGVFSI